LTAVARGGLLASLAGAVFRVGRRAARPLPERRPAKFRRANFHLVQGRQRAHLLARSRPISFVLDCIFEFALNFRPQSIFLRDRNEAFVFVMLTSAPSPILEVLCGVAKGVVGHARRSMPCISRREHIAVSQPPVPGTSHSADDAGSTDAVGAWFPTKRRTAARGILREGAISAPSPPSAAHGLSRNARLLASAGEPSPPDASPYA